MKAVQKTTPGIGFTIEDIPIPDIGIDEVLIEVEATSICGTDLHIWNWDQSIAGMMILPVTVGHEMAGNVVKVGKKVANFKEGDYVSAESHITCGLCNECVKSRFHMCLRHKTLGIDVDGTFAEYIKVPEKVLWRNNRHTLPPEIATLQEPLGNAVYATRNQRLEGKKVAVLGCGPIGLFTIAIAKAAGADIIVGSDLSPYRLGLAGLMGAQELFNPATDGDTARFLKDLSAGQGMDVVFEMSGAQAAINAAFKGVKKGGSVILFGIPAGPVTLDLTRDLIFKNVNVEAVSGRRIFEDWYESRALLETGAVNLRPLISKQIPLTDVEEGIRLLRTGETCKIVLRPKG